MMQITSPIPKVVYQWRGDVMYMGIQKNPNGTGFRLLEPADDAHECRYCGGRLVYEYPHTHTRADWEREHKGKS